MPYFGPSLAPSAAFLDARKYSGIYDYLMPPSDDSAYAFILKNTQNVGNTMGDAAGLANCSLFAVNGGYIPQGYKVYNYGPVLVDNSYNFVRALTTSSGLNLATVNGYIGAQSGDTCIITIANTYTIGGYCGFYIYNNTTGELDYNTLNSLPANYIISAGTGADGPNATLFEAGNKPYCALFGAGVTPGIYAAPAVFVPGNNIAAPPAGFISPWTLLAQFPAGLPAQPLGSDNWIGCPSFDGTQYHLFNYQNAGTIYYVWWTLDLTTGLWTENTAWNTASIMAGIFATADNKFVYWQGSYGWTVYDPATRTSVNIFIGDTPHYTPSYRNNKYIIADLGNLSASEFYEINFHNRYGINYAV